MKRFYDGLDDIDRFFADLDATKSHVNEFVSGYQRIQMQTWADKDVRDWLDEQQLAATLGG